MKQRCGFVSLIGAPNSGKSTLLNQLVGTKVSIVTRKIQTTRSRVLGLFIHEDSQVVLIDTPGIFNPKHKFERAMVRAAWSTVKEADLVAVIVDVHQKSRINDTFEIVSSLNEDQVTPLLLLNKVDLIDKDELLKIADEFNKKFKISSIFMISALKGDGLSALKDYLAKEVPEGPWLYPADQITDLPERLLAAEITREKIFHFLHQEIPYSIAVETASWEEFENGSVKINQTIFVLNENQRSIVLGKNGHQIKQIGEKSREELKSILGRTVHLFLHVKVRENWRETPDYYKTLGLDFNS